MHRRGKLVLLAIFLAALIAAHWSELRLPYFWDEAGYFVPAAHDLYTTGDPIPHSVTPIPHPPLAFASLALASCIFGFSVVVSRLTMLCWAALALLATYLLGERLGGIRVGLLAALCTSVYPVFFTQSVFVLLDLPAAAMVLWGLVFYLDRKLLPAALCLSAAVLCKESGAIAVIPLLFLERRSTKRTLAILSLPAIVFVLWFAFVFLRTGNIFASAGFAQYNMTGFSPARLLAALIHRVWDTFGHFFLFLLTIPAAVILIRRRGRGVPLVLALTIALYVVVFSVFGGALLARYMLPAVVLVIVISVSLLVRYAWIAVPLALVGFVTGLFIPPPYHYGYEENLIWHDFVRVHQQAAAVLASERMPVITTWPATDELSNPYLGYVTVPLSTIGVPDFSHDGVIRLARECTNCAILFFPTQYEPADSPLRPGTLLRRFEFWKNAQQRFETRPATLTPEALAAAIGAKIAWRTQSGPVYAAILRIR